MKKLCLTLFVAFAAASCSDNANSGSNIASIQDKVRDSSSFEVVLHKSVDDLGNRLEMTLSRTEGGTPKVLEPMKTKTGALRPIEGRIVVRSLAAGEYKFEAKLKNGASEEHKFTVSAESVERFIVKLRHDSESETLSFEDVNAAKGEMLVKDSDTKWIEYNIVKKFSKREVKRENGQFVKENGEYVFVTTPCGNRRDSFRLLRSDKRLKLVSRKWTSCDDLKPTESEYQFSEAASQVLTSKLAKLSAENSDSPTCRKNEHASSERGRGVASEVSRHLLIRSQDEVTRVFREDGQTCGFYHGFLSQSSWKALTDIFDVARGFAFPTNKLSLDIGEGGFAGKSLQMPSGYIDEDVWIFIPPVQFAGNRAPEELCQIEMKVWHNLKAGAVTNVVTRYDLDTNSVESIRGSDKDGSSVTMIYAQTLAKHGAVVRVQFDQQSDGDVIRPAVSVSLDLYCDGRAKAK